MFRAVGYLDDDEPATPPEQVTLWRGGVKKTRMSWSGTRERAVWFQRRYSETETGKPGKLWTVTVGPDRLLAHYHEKPKEDEYVIDPTGLRPREQCGLSAGRKNLPNFHDHIGFDCAGRSIDFTARIKEA